MGQYRNRKNGGLVWMDEETAGLFHGEYEPVEAAKPEKEGTEKEQDAPSPVLKGAALDAALKEAGLSLEGTADEKRARLADASVL